MKERQEKTRTKGRKGRYRCLYTMDIVQVIKRDVVLLQLMNPVSRVLDSRLLQGIPTTLESLIGLSTPY